MIGLREAARLEQHPHYSIIRPQVAPLDLGAVSFTSLECGIKCALAAIVVGMRDGGKDRLILHLLNREAGDLKMSIIDKPGLLIPAGPGAADIQMDTDRHHIEDELLLRFLLRERLLRPLALGDVDDGENFLMETAVGLAAGLAAQEHPHDGRIGSQVALF